VKKKTIWIWVLLFVLIAAGAVGYKVYASNRSSAATEIQTETVTNGSLSSTLSSSGNTRAGQTATIVWEASGKVGDVTLKPGDIVEADQVLAALDPNTLSSEMIKAKQDLIDAQQNLDDLLNSKSLQAKAMQAVEDAQTALNSLKQNAAKESSQAQLAVATAEEALSDAQDNRLKMDYPHSSDKLVIEKAETNYLLAKKAYNEALNNYAKYANRALTQPDRVRALNQLVSAKQALTTALATWNWYQSGYSENEIAQADAEVAVAQANLEKVRADYELLKGGSSQAEIAMAEATLADALRSYERVKAGASKTDIEAAQAAVDAAQATLDHATLLAPFGGTITEVDIATGDLVSTGDGAFRIDDLASLYIDLQISEVDLSSIEVGQKATLEFDAIADKTYNGEVTGIGMIGTVSQGVVNYPVTVRITDADEDIRPGMTASISIITDEVADALLVPNKAIRTSNGQRMVTVLFEGQQIMVPVSVGLVGDSYSQVVSDQLREGDIVVINGTTSTTTTTNRQMEGNFMVGPGFEAGGGPPGGIP
jgi:HlyD family secretion protein